MDMIIFTHASVAALEAVYAKRSSELDIIRQKIQIVKDENSLIEVKTLYGNDIDWKLAVENKEIKLALKKFNSAYDALVYMKDYLEYNPEEQPFQQMMNGVNNVTVFAECPNTIEEITLERQRLKEHDQYLALNLALKQGDAVLLEKREEIRRIEAGKQAIEKMEEELAEAKAKLATAEEDWLLKWGDESGLGS